MQACETDVTFVLKLILQTQGEYVVFPVLFISLYEIALFIEVELVIGLHADMLVETVQSADAECALGEVGLGGQAVFNADLIPFQLGVGIINVVFQDGRERSGSDVVHQIEKVADETVDAIIVANKSGLVAFKAKVFIDATGDGDLAAWAGASFKRGDDSGVVQSSSLCFSFANVDSYNYNLTGPSLHTSNKNSPVYKAIESGKYPLIDKHFNSNFIGPDVVQFNAGHLDNVDSTDPWATTQAMMVGRQIAGQYLEAMKDVQPKTFGSAFLVKTASLLGVRDSRRIEGDYTFTVEDWKERRTFEDEIGRNCYYIDVHKPGHKETRYKKGESHGIPYRCLTPKGLKNVLTAGRCISTDEEAFGSLRVMPPCLVTGEAAGMAAVHAIKQARNDVHKIDTDYLRKRLKEEGQYLL